MFRHVVMFRFTPEATADQIRHLSDGLDQLPGAIPEIRAYRHGPNGGTAPDNWHYVVVADFEDAAAHQIYAAHERHQHLIADRVRPILAERAGIQYEI